MRPLCRQGVTGNHGVLWEPLLPLEHQSSNRQSQLPRGLPLDLCYQPLRANERERRVLSNLSVRALEYDTPPATVKRHHTDYRPNLPPIVRPSLIHHSFHHSPTMSTLPDHHVTKGDIVALSITGTFVLFAVSVAISVLIGMYCTCCCHHQQHPPSPNPVPMTRTERHRGTPRPHNPTQGPGSRV